MNFLLVREGVGFGDAPAYKEENMTICNAATGYRSCSEMIMLIYKKNIFNCIFNLPALFLSDRLC